MPRNSSYDIAVIYAGLDDKDRTFDWLNRAYEEHSGFLLFVKQEPRLEPLRAEPHFQDVLLPYGVPQPEGVMRIIFPPNNPRARITALGLEGIAT